MAPNLIKANDSQLFVSYECSKRQKLFPYMFLGEEAGLASQICLVGRCN